MSNEKDSEPYADHADVIPGADAAQRALYLQFAEKPEEWRRQQDARILRKIDWHLFPFLVVMYLLNFLDRSNLAQGRQVSIAG